MKLTKEELNKLIKEAILPRGWDKNRFEQLKRLSADSKVLKKMGLELEDIEVMQGMDWYDEEGNTTDWAHRIVMTVSEPAPKPPPPEQNTKAKGTHLSLVRESKAKKQRNNKVKITKTQLKRIIKEEISSLMEMGKEVEKEVYKQYWKAAVENLYDDDPGGSVEYYEDYDPNSDDSKVKFLVGFAYSRIRHALGHYGDTPRSTPQEIIDAIQEGWEEGYDEYAYTQEDY